MTSSTPRRLGARLGSLADDLDMIVGAANVLSDRSDVASYGTDWTGRYGNKRCIVVRPGTVQELAGVIEAAAAYGVAVVPQGGNTGLVGGSVPNRHDALIVSTRRLTSITAFDATTGHVTVGAGVTLEQLDAAVVADGWRCAIDLGARGSATIGGMISTNAGGMRVFRFGSMRHQLLGLEYVAADGRIASHLNALTKDNTGYDLGSLLCGAEGTLGVVSAARLRLIPTAPRRVVALCAFSELDDALAFAWEIRRGVPSAEAIEYLDGPCADLVSMMRQVPLPVSGASLVLVEAAGRHDPLDELAAVIGAAEARPDDVAFGLNPGQQRQLWALREELTSTLALLGPVFKYDISVPRRQIDHVRNRIEAALRTNAPRSTPWWFGHVCDDNVHLNITGADATNEYLDELVLGVVLDAGGSISAEHGIGVHKAPFLQHARSPVELGHMLAIKAALDPQGIMNPGVIFPTTP